jgi:hypothetical protein
LPYTSEPSLQKVRSSPYLPTELSPLMPDDKIDAVDSKEILQQYKSSIDATKNSSPTSSIEQKGEIDDTPNSLLDTESRTLSQVSSFFHEWNYK